MFLTVWLGYARGRVHERSEGCDSDGRGVLGEVDEPFHGAVMISVRFSSPVNMDGDQSYEAFTSVYFPVGKKTHPSPPIAGSWWRWEMSDLIGHPWAASREGGHSGIATSASLIFSIVSAGCVAEDAAPAKAKGTASTANMPLEAFWASKVDSRAIVTAWLSRAFSASSSFSVPPASLAASSGGIACTYRPDSFSAATC